VDVDDEVLAEDAGLLLPHHLDVKRITNNDSELYALVRALEACPDGADVSAYSDSQCTLMRMARIARGQAPTKTMNQELYDRAEAALSRLGEVCFVHVKGHPTRSDLERGRTSKGRLVSRHQVRCDDLCTEKAQEYMDTLSTSPTLMGRR
jgi:hypothetical protein